MVLVAVTNDRNPSRSDAGAPLAKVRSGFSGNLQIDKYDMFMADNNNNNDANKRIEVYTYNNPVVALSEFK
jgi:hypothetical protein